MLIRVVALFFALIVNAVAADIYVRQDITPRQTTGAYASAYPDGLDSVALDWGTCPNLQLFTGDTQSFNLRTLCSLTGTNALTATLAKVSGTLPTGCSEATNGISCTNAQASMGQTFVWRATDGNSFDTASFSFVVVDPPAGDTTAPTIPTACTFTPGTGTITVECDQSSDPYVGEAGSGLAWYRIYKDGVLVASKAAPSANVQPNLSAMTVGSADGTQSATQTGADRAMSGGGAGLGSTTDQLYGIGHQVVGDTIATATVGSFAGAVTTSTAGWMVRVSDAQGSIYGTCRVRDSDDKANNRYRATTGASASNTTLTDALTLPIRLKLLLENSTATCLTSTDGLTYTATAAATPLSLGTQPYVLAFHASGTALTNTTSSISQINIAPVTRWSQSVSTTGSGSWTVKAEDADGNLSAATTAVTAAPEETVACTGSTDITVIHADDFEIPADDQWVSGDTSTIADGDRADSCKPSNPVAGNCTVSRWTISDDFSYSVDTPQTLSDNHARNGNFSARAQVTHHNGVNAWYTTSNGIAKRNEWAAKSSSADGFPNSVHSNGAIGEDWYGISIYLPGDPEISTTPNADPQFGELDAWGDLKLADSPYPATRTMLQWHDIADPAGSREENGQPCGDTSRNNVTMSLNFSLPPNGVTTDSNGRTNSTGNIQLWNIHDAEPCTNSGGNGPITYYNLGTWHLMRGRWTDWIFRWKATHTNAGILEVWKQIVGVDSAPVKVVSAIGTPSSNNDLQQNYAKVGIYQFPGPNAAVPPNATMLTRYPQKTIVYHDDWKHIRVIGNPSTAVGPDNCAFRSVSPAND